MHEHFEIPHPQLEEATIADLQAQMENGQLSSQELVRMYLERIDKLDRSGPSLRSVIEVNPDAGSIADSLDRERKESRSRGPLHGIPILLKDNIDTKDRTQTTAGSLALFDAPPHQDAFVVKRLREAGAVILGKANLSEWANFRSTHSSSGWSARGGQARNPYVLDRSTSGSSSGSASSVAANLVSVSLGTETDGSIISPAAVNGVVGIKPTVGLTSRAGVVPISHSQDTVGPFGRTVADSAAVLDALTGVDAEDPATAESAGRFHADYTQFLQAEGLKRARIGVAREVYFGYSPAADGIVDKAIEIMRHNGAEIVDPADIPTAKVMRTSGVEMEVLLYEFKADIETYLRRYRPDAGVKMLADLIEFNRDHAQDEMPHFAQELFLMAQAKGTLTDEVYRQALAESHQLSRQDGIDAVMDRYQLDALVMPSGNPAWNIDWVNGDHHLGGSTQAAAMAGYPVITVPAGDVHGLPVGVSFVGRAFSEPTLIRLAYGFEQAARARRRPEYQSTILDGNLTGGRSMRAEQVRP